MKIIDLDKLNYVYKIFEPPLSKVFLKNEYCYKVEIAQHQCLTTFCSREQLVD
jgi:hypothetical protein